MFDSYHEWLGIPASEQPPNHYRLLAIPAFEESPTVIANAADRQMAHLRTFQTGKYSALSQKLLNEVATAKLDLLNPRKKTAYDQQLRQHLPPNSGPADRSEAFSLDPALAAVLRSERSSAPGDRRKVRGKKSRRKPVGLIVAASLTAVSVGFAVWLAIGRGSTRNDGRVAKVVDPVTSAAPATEAVPKSTGPSKEKTPTPVTTERKKESEADDPRAAPILMPTEPETVAEAKPEPQEGKVAESKRASHDSAAKPEADEETTKAKKPAPPSTDEQKRPMREIDEMRKPGTAKPPPPSAEALKVTMQAVHDLYRAAYADAKTTAEQIELATEITKKGKEIQDDPPSSFALLRLARDIAVGAGDLRTGLAAIDALAERFEIDAMAMKVETAEKALAAARNPVQQKAVAAEVVALAQIAVGQGDVEQAEALAKLALEAAKKGRDAKRIKQITQLRSDIALAAEAKNKFNEALAVLQQDPSAPAANRTVGLYRCSIRDDWQHGLQNLSLSSDAVLCELAKKELAGAKSTDEQVELGDGWFAVAARESGAAKFHIQEHAAVWYRKVLPNVKGMVKEKLTSRLLELDKEDNPSTPEKSSRTTKSSKGGRTARARPINVAALQLRQSVRAFDNGCYSLAFTRDGTRLLGTAHLGAVKLLDASTGAIRASFGPEGYVGYQTRFSTDESLLYITNDRGHLIVYDSKGKLRDKILCHAEGPVRALAVSPDGSYVATGGDDFIIKLLKLNSPPRTFEGQKAKVNCLAFSPDGYELASGGDDKTVKLWDVRKGTIKAVLGPHREPVTCVAYSPDGTILASASRDKIVRLWNPARAQLRGGITGHQAAVNYLAFSADGSVIATAGDDSQLALWAVGSGQLLRTFPHEGKPVRTVAFSADGTMLASSDGDGNVRVWAVKAK